MFMLFSQLIITNLPKSFVMVYMDVLNDYRYHMSLNPFKNHSCKVEQIVTHIGIGSNKKDYGIVEYYNQVRHA